MSILLNEKLGKLIKDWEARQIGNKCIIAINLPYKLIIYEVYGILNDTNLTEKDHFFEVVSQEISKVGNNRDVMILGDPNRTGTKISDHFVETFEANTVNENGKG